MRIRRLFENRLILQAMQSIISDDKLAVRWAWLHKPARCSWQSSGVNNGKRPQGGQEMRSDMQTMHFAFIGKSGYSKSSLIKAIIERDLMKTCAIDACT